MSLADRLAKAQQKDRISDVRGSGAGAPGRGPRPPPVRRHAVRHRARRPGPPAPARAPRRRGGSALRAGEAPHRPPDRRQRPGSRAARAVRPRPGSDRDHGQQLGHDLRRARRQALLDRHEVPRRAAAPPHDRQDRREGRPPRRRGVALRRRSPARRLACERDHPAAVDRRSGAHDPEVRRRPVPGRRPDRVRHDDLAGRRSSSRRASAAGSTSWSPAERAPGRRPP